MSYSSELKKTLKEMSMKKKCCRRAAYEGGDAEHKLTCGKHTFASFYFTGRPIRPEESIFVLTSIRTGKS